MHGQAPGSRGQDRPWRCCVTVICEWTRSTPSQAIRLAEKRNLKTQHQSASTNPERSLAYVKE